MPVDPVWYPLCPILPPIHFPTFQCCALLKLAVCTVSLSICITCSALPKLMVSKLCGLSVCAPGCCASFFFFSPSCPTAPIPISLLKLVKEDSLPSLLRLVTAAQCCVQLPMFPLALGSLSCETPSKRKRGRRGGYTHNLPTTRPTAVAVLPTPLFQCIQKGHMIRVAHDNMHLATSYFVFT